jgi:two-component sensor histidine kinase
VRLVVHLDSDIYGYVPWHGWTAAAPEPAGADRLVVSGVESDEATATLEVWGEELAPEPGSVILLGSGLGLAIVGQVVLGHDGQIRVESRVGEGTTLTIELPTAGA